jgi:signal peptidase II
MRALPLENLSSPAAMARFVLTTVAGVWLDLWSKALAVEHLKEGRRGIAFIPGYLHFDYTENHGAVFGIGQGQRTLFLLVSVGAIAFLTYLFAQSGKQRWYQVLLGMLLAGVLGNLYDRFTYGYVRDMLHALPKWGVFPWIFNVADSLLCVGVFLMLVHGLFQTHPTADAATPRPEEEAGRAGGVR